MTHMMLSKMDTTAFLSRFEPIDFSEIHMIVKNLAGTSGPLSPKELEVAIDIITQWCDTTLNRVSERRNYISHFKQYFHFTERIHFDKEMFEESAVPLAYLTGTELWLSQLISAEEELHVHKKNKPEYPLQHLGITKYEKLLLDKQYKMNFKIYANKGQKLLRKIYRIQKGWKNELFTHDLFNQIMEKAGTFCSSNHSMLIKSLKNIAIINIVVSDEKLRTDLLKILNTD